MRALTYICVLFLAAWPAAAQEDTARFVSALPDVPLMPGLVEAPQDTLVFDKAQGRIIQVSLVSGGPTQAQIAAFYARTLPQFGWHPTGDSRWHRADEALTLTFIQPEAGRPLLARIRVAPMRE
jgi:hypothetical protein